MKKLWGGLVALCVVAAACAPKAETPASPRLTRTCDSLCAKRASCEKNFSAEACNKRCTTYESIRKLEGYRGDAGDRILECVDKNACPDELAVTMKRCAVDAAKTLPTSEKARSLCASLEPQFRDCNIRWETPCLTQMTLFDPADLGAFDECVNRQCRGGLACVNEAEHTILMKHAK